MVKTRYQGEGRAAWAGAGAELSVSLFFMRVYVGVILPQESGVCDYN
jgi:hypothetical protein